MRWSILSCGALFLVGCSGDDSSQGKTSSGGAAGSGGIDAGTGGGSGGSVGGNAGSGGTTGGAGGAPGGSGGVGGATGGGGAAGASGAGGVAGAAGTAGSGGASTFCPANTSEPCYTGPSGTDGVGSCKAGSHTCDAAGSAWGPCVGEVLPGPAETCALPVLDSNCDGLLAQNCCTSGAWDVVPIDTDGITGFNNVIGVETGGTVHIGYSEFTQVPPSSYKSSARYAQKLQGGAWTKELVSEVGKPAANVAFSMDSGGGMHALYTWASGNNYLTRTGPNAWSKEAGPSLSSTVSSDVVLSVQPNDAAHAAWRASNQVHYSERTGAGTWVPTLISNYAVGSRIDIATRANGDVFLLYPVAVCSVCSLSELVLSKKSAGGTFVDATLANTAGLAAMAIDGQGGAHVVFTDSFGDVKIGKETPSGFTSTPCYANVCPDPGGDIGFALDATGSPHFAYGSGGKLRYFHSNGTAIVAEEIGPIGITYGPVSLAVDSAGGVHVSYMDDNANFAVLRYAYRCP